MYLTGLGADRIDTRIRTVVPVPTLPTVHTIPTTDPTDPRYEETLLPINDTAAVVKSEKVNAPIQTSVIAPRPDLRPDQKILAGGELQNITDSDILIMAKKADGSPREPYYTEAVRRGLFVTTTFTAPVVEVGETVTDLQPIPSETGNYAEEIPTFIEAAQATDNNFLKYAILGLGAYILFDSLKKVK